MKVEKDLSGNKLKKDKVDKIKEATSDSLFSADMKKVTEDFDAVDFETLDDSSTNSLYNVNLS